MSQTRILYGALLLTALVGNAAAVTHSNKTFLSPRPHGVNTAMEYTTWNQHPYKKHAPNIRSHVQATAFYQGSQRGSALGKYFGIGNGSNSFTIGPAANVASGTADVDGSLLIHNLNARTGAVTAPQGTITFDPKQETFGVRFDYFQDLTHPFDKLFFRASAPLVDIETNVHMNVANSVPSAVGGQSYSLANFFAGQVSVTDKTAYPANLQTNLNHDMIIGRRTELGLGDLDLGLGYKYLDDAKKHVFFSLDLTIPTGNKVHSRYLFQPVCGNGLHVGLGGSIDAGIDLWHSEKALLKLLGVVRYKYLFENTEHRTLDVKGYKFSQYYLLAQDQQANLPLIPAANILTLPTTVKPGSQLDGMLDFVFNCCKFTLDLGYNMYWRDAESVWVKRFANATYGIVKNNYNTQAAFNAVGGDAATIPLNGHLLTTSDLDVTAIKTPTLFSHKLFAGMGYSFNFYKQYMSSVGIGGSYEFATSNADLENYALWAKMMFSF